MLHVYQVNGRNEYEFAVHQFFNKGLLLAGTGCSILPSERQLPA